MLPLTTLNNDYIDQPKFTEHKNPSEFIVPPPTKVGRKNLSKMTECRRTVQ